MSGTPTDPEDGKGGSRRAFLRKLARTAVFIPPAIVTLDVSRAWAQGQGGGGGQPSVLGPGNCPPGTHWDPQQQECVPRGQGQARMGGDPPTLDAGSGGGSGGGSGDGGPPPPWERRPPDG